MRTLNIISYLALAYLTYLFIRSIIIPEFHKMYFKYKENKLLKNGNKKFFFEKNTVIVYAHTREQANYKYNKMKKELKNKKNAVLGQR
jgi:hypothetical protein